MANASGSVAIGGPWRLLGRAAIIGGHGHRPVVLTGGRDGGLVTRNAEGLLTHVTVENPNVRLALAAPEVLEVVRRVGDQLSRWMEGLELLDGAAVDRFKQNVIDPVVARFTEIPRGPVGGLGTAW